MSRTVLTLLQEHPEIQYHAGRRGNQFGIWYCIGVHLDLGKYEEYRAFGIIEGPDLDSDLDGPPNKYQINAILTVLNSVKLSKA